MRALALMENGAGERVGAGQRVWAAERVGAVECRGTADGGEGLRGKIWSSGGRGLCMLQPHPLLLLSGLLMAVVAGVQEALQV